MTKYKHHPIANWPETAGEHNFVQMYAFFEDHRAGIPYLHFGKKDEKHYEILIRVLEKLGLHSPVYSIFEKDPETGKETEKKIPGLAGGGHRALGAGKAMVYPEEYLCILEDSEPKNIYRINLDEEHAKEINARLEKGHGKWHVRYRKGIESRV